MTPEELLADTNRLLQRLVAIEDERKAEAERYRAESDFSLAEMKKKTDESMAQRLKERGLSEDAAAGGDEDWDKRFKAVQQKSRENMDAMRVKDEQYKEQLLQELRTQSDLLKQIAKKLES